MSNEFTLGQWVETAPEVFDLDEKYLSEIAPLVGQLGAACAAIGLPLFVTVTVSQGADGSNRVRASSALIGPARVTGEQLALVQLHQAGLLGFSSVAAVSAVVKADAERTSNFYDSPSAGVH